MDLNARTWQTLPAMQLIARRIRLNSIWLLLARLITQVQLVIFTILVARRLGVAGFGQYAFVVAVIFLGNVVTTFGTDTLLIREVARHPATNKELITTTIGLQLALSIVWVIVMVTSTGALQQQPVEVVAALKVYSLSLIPLAFFTSFTAVLRAHERMDLYLLLSAVVATLQLSGAWLVLQASGTLLALVIMLNVVQLVAALFAGILCYLGLPGFRLNWNSAFRQTLRHQVVRVMRLAWPFALLSVLAMIYQRLGVLMLSTLGTETQTGWYAAAARVIEPVKMLHFAVLGALLPALASLATAEPLATRVFRRSLLFLVTISAVLAVVISLLAPAIVSELFGADYAGAVPLIQILAVSLMPYTIAASWSVRLVTQGRERHIVWATALSLILAFTLNYWLIPSYGSIGTALTVVGSESLLAAALLIARR